MKICKVKNCNNKSRSNGYCEKHYMQTRLYGKILKRTRFDKNEIIDCGDYYEICLYVKAGNGQKEIARAKIDKEDLEKIKEYKWCLSNGYVLTRTKGKTLYLHQLILGKRKNYETDHINHNKIDNRKQNLRYCTRSENSMNKKVKGYYWRKDRNKWYARININKKQIHLGYFKEKIDAIKARKQAEIKYFGFFRYINI